MTETYSRLRQSKSIFEFFSLLPYSIIEYFAAVPLVLFLLSPVLYVLRNCIGYWNYELVIGDIMELGRTLAVIVFFLYLCKGITQKQHIRQFIRNNSSLCIFLLFACLMVVTTAYHGFTNVSIYGTSARTEGLYNDLIYILVCFLCASLIENNSLKWCILRLFVTGGLVLGILSLIDLYITQIPMFMHTTANVSAVFVHFNHYGYYLTLILLVSAGIAAFDKNLPFRILGWFSFVINTIALIRDDTFGCYLAVAFGLVFAQIVHFILRKRTNKAIWCVLGAYIGISFVLSFWYHTVFRNFLTLFFDLGKIISEEDAEHAGSSRWGLWMQSLQFIAERPLTGWGVEGKADELVGCTRPHNEYLQQMLFFGIPAGLLYIWGILEVYLHGLRNKLHLDAPTLVALIAAFGYIVSAFFGNTTYYVSPMFFCILGLGYRVAGK